MGCLGRESERVGKIVVRVAVEGRKGPRASGDQDRRKGAVDVLRRGGARVVMRCGRVAERQEGGSRVPRDRSEVSSVDRLGLGGARNGRTSLRVAEKR